MFAAIREWLRRLRATFHKAPEDAEMAALVAVGLIAAYVPARRATRVEPVIALRSE